jgi:hypothetical protein
MARYLRTVYLRAIHISVTYLRTMYDMVRHARSDNAYK